MAVRVAWCRAIFLAGLLGAACPWPSATAVAGGVVDSSAGVPRVRFLALGDVNLGRKVGKEILNGDTLYPFAYVKDTLAQYDFVFANLESNLSDQGGETQSPRNNLIFTGPPAGAASLRRAGVTVVSTANNHALDYGNRALRETMHSLEDAGVLFAGTSADSAGLFSPVIFVRHGIRIALFACTDVMNFTDPSWRHHVAPADTAMLLPAIRAVRDSVDFILVSCHAGEEYADQPARKVKSFARAVVRGGADLFLGHHPHVPYGVEEVEGRYIVYSLGNFVFGQPDRYWTQHSFAFEAQIEKDGSGTRLRAMRCIPVLCGLRPRFVTSGPDAVAVMKRIKSLSSREVMEHIAW